MRNFLKNLRKSFKTIVFEEEAITESFIFGDMRIKIKVGWHNESFGYCVCVEYPGLKKDIFQFRNKKNVCSFIATIPVRYERFKKEKSLIKTELLKMKFVNGCKELLDDCVLQLDCGAVINVAPSKCGGYDVKCNFAGYHPVHREWILNNDELAAFIQAVPRMQRMKDDEKNEIACV